MAHKRVYALPLSKCNIRDRCPKLDARLVGARLGTPLHHLRWPTHESSPLKMASTGWIQVDHDLDVDADDFDCVDDDVHSGRRAIRTGRCLQDYMQPRRRPEQCACGTSFHGLCYSSSAHNKSRNSDCATGKSGRNLGTPSSPCENHEERPKLPEGVCHPPSSSRNGNGVN